MIGAFAGAALTGGRLGPIGWCMAATIALDVFACMGLGNGWWQVLILLASIPAGFLIGAGIELAHSAGAVKPP